MLSNPVQHQQTKHIEIDLHFVRDKVATDHVHVLHVHSPSQYANIFTKSLPSLLFLDFRSNLNVRDPPPVLTIGGMLADIFIISYVLLFYIIGSLALILMQFCIYTFNE